MITKSFKLYGDNNFLLSTNFLSYGDESMTIAELANNFGTPESNNEFACGTGTVSPYDLGLLYSTFTALVAAQTHTGTSVNVEEAETDKEDLECLWLGQYLLVYSKKDKCIIPITPADVLSVCHNQERIVNNFCDLRSYHVSRERKYLHIDNEDGTSMCTVEIPKDIIASFPTLFEVDGHVRQVEDDPCTEWDERSDLGALISVAIGNNAIEEAIEAYSSKVFLGSVVVRDDLLMEPTKRYEDTRKFLGSICYTDKEEIALSVNLRGSLFVYKDWFHSSNALKTRVVPDFSNFYDVTESVNKIEMFAKTISRVPLTNAQLDQTLFNKITKEFYAVNLPRVKLTSCFGRIVIPESVLCKAIKSNFCAVYCIVPVGVIGMNVICKNADGELYDIHTDGIVGNDIWDIDDYFYDITEVV